MQMNFSHYASLFLHEIPCGQRFLGSEANTPRPNAFWSLLVACGCALSVFGAAVPFAAGEVEVVVAPTVPPASISPVFPPCARAWRDM